MIAQLLTFLKRNGVSRWARCLILSIISKGEGVKEWQLTFTRTQNEKG